MSAEDGRDVTPEIARLATGQLVAIRTGELEEHITGDVAWAAAYYLAWTGDQAFATGPAAVRSDPAKDWGRKTRIHAETRPPPSR